MDLFTIFLIFFTIFIIFLIKRLIEFKRYAEIIDKIPGPKKKFFYGNVLDLKGLKREEIFDNFIVKRHYDYPGGISRFWTFNRAEVRLSKPEYVEKVLSSSKNITKPKGYELEFKKWLGDGLILSTGEHWFSHRKVITPTFHFTILEDFYEVFVEKIEILMKKLGEEVGKEIDIGEPINLAALDIICGSKLINFFFAIRKFTKFLS